jgi:FAD/FMN-containing dehydrogenase
VPLAGGTVVGRIPGLRKDNTGYDMTCLLAGSEGTLAVITRVHLALVAYLPDRVVALCALDGFADARTVSAALRKRVAGRQNRLAITKFNRSSGSSVAGVSDTSDAINIGPTADRYFGDISLAKPICAAA